MRIDINNNWLWAPVFEEDMLRPAFDGEDKMEKVRIPHTVKITPLNYFDAHEYQMVSCYRKTFDAPSEWKDKKVFVTFDAAAHEAEVYINGVSVAKHSCGYTAFTAELTEHLKFGEKNVIAVKCDSRESLNVPPFGFVIDYMTYGGIYREVHLDVKEKDHIRDVFVSAGADKKVTIKTETEGEGELVCMITEISSGKVLFAEPCEKDAQITVNEAKLWSLDDPNLYELTMTLRNGDKEDTFTTKFGFRDAVFKTDGFYLNGKKIKLRGLNRHQCWPYVGYAMPKSMQQMDADILKNELGLNAVRTSHYPQSHHFIDRCDEIGLLVFTEIPGWQNIGDEEWKEQAVINTREMVSQYRNHPSIILWGVRINESVDCDELYTRTNKEAHDLDPTRQTSGVRYLKKSSLLEDVYAFNDFSHNGKTAGCEQKKNVTSDMNKPYFISEYNGHMYPTKTFDSELHRQEHALRHCNVLDSVMANEDILGSFGWCMFDYNTHKDFGSGDRVCYHGVTDMFRNPKLAAYAYASQNKDIDPVLEISSSMDIGEHPAGNRGEVYIFSNCDSVKMYKNDVFIKEYTREDSSYKNLISPPMLIDDYIGDQMKEQEGFTDRQNKIVKDALNFSAVYGMENMPAKMKLTMVEAMARYKMKFDDAYMLFGKYIGNWGGEATRFRFDGIKDGKVVKTVTKSAMTGLRLVLDVSSNELVEGATYDVAAIRIKITDEYGNVMPFFNHQALLEVTGDIEVLGPALADINGGMGGVYVRSIGQEGKAAVKISLPDQGLSSEVGFDIRLGV
ncbi:MAG: glycoside hydrolase family 2 TIM barrel-domain containing protein [Saccharofermentans sp.]|nr:glycoside hydrolase family 2 TIM barrel-domain containing protein [Saccharofermentans sp.]